MSLSLQKFDNSQVRLVIKYYLMYLQEPTYKRIFEEEQSVVFCGINTAFLKRTEFRLFNAIHSSHYSTVTQTSW